MNIAIMGKIHPDGLELFKKNGLSFFEIESFEEKNLILNLKNVDGIVLRTAKLTNSVISECKSLKIISRHGVGYDNVDLEYLNKNNIGLGITGTSNAISVAEHVMSMFFTITKRMNDYDQLVKSGNFKKKYDLGDFFELYNKNVLILGFGRIGQALAKRCLGFEMKVYVYDPYVKENIIKKNNCIPIEKNEAFEIADYISIHLPLNDKTRNLISEKEFGMFKKNMILVNTSRGGIINEKELYNALNEKKIFGAGLDVFETEPPRNDNPLLSLNNIVLTPHNAALTLESRKRMSIESCKNVVDFLLIKKSLNINNFVNWNLIKNYRFK
tara:strand:- start:1313 stop:2293 length:981 start_codon:yes stop_codon:yes gene_type:complete